MLYHVMYDVQGSIVPLWEAVRQLGNSYLFQKQMYLNTELSKQEVLKLLSQSVGKDDQIFLIPMDDNYITKQPNTIKAVYRQWQRDEEIKRFEKEQQEALKQYNLMLDAIEIELQKQLNEKGE